MMGHALVVCHWRGLVNANVDSALMTYAVGSWGGDIAWINDNEPRVLGSQFQSIQQIIDLHPDHAVVALVPDDAGERLNDFRHPPDAIYIVGADDVGFEPPKNAIQVAIDTPTGPTHPLYSWQVVTCVLYDRFVKDV